MNSNKEPFTVDALGRLYVPGAKPEVEIVSVLGSGVEPDAALIEIHFSPDVLTVTGVIHVGSSSVCTLNDTA